MAGSTRSSGKPHGRRPGARVTQRGAERPPRQNYHVLCRPDGDRLFLLAALPPGDLTRRYRRRAAFAFLRLRRCRVRARLAAAERVRLNPGPLHR